MKITFKSIVIIRATESRHTAKIEIPRSVWQEHGIKAGDKIRVAIVGRVFETKVFGDDTQKRFPIPIELRRELRLRDSETVEVEIEKIEGNEGGDNEE